MSLHEVRVYDGEGNLKKIVNPEINYEPQNWRAQEKYKVKRLPANTLDPVSKENIIRFNMKEGESN